MRAPSISWSIQAVAALAIVAAAPSAHALKFRVVDLGTDVYVTDLNNKGEYIGMARSGYNDASGPGYFWDASGKRTTLPAINGRAMFWPESLNDLGDVLGVTGENFVDGAGSITGALVNAKTGVVTNNPAMPLTASSRINNAGQLSGYPGPDSLNMFVWTPGSGFNYLYGDASKGVTPAFGVINNKGAVLGANQPGNDTPPLRSFFWSAQSGYKLISSTIKGYPNLILVALSDNNQGVGQVIEQNIGTGRSLPVIWSASTGVRVLTGNGTASSIAESVNSSGNVVGRNLNTQLAFFWSPLTGIKTLNSLLTGVPTGTSIQIKFASKINNLNQILVGGTINGVERAMLLIPVR